MGELMNCGVLRACGRLCVLRNELVGFFEWWVMGCCGSLTLREKKRTAQPTHWTMKQSKRASQSTLFQSNQLPPSVCGELMEERGGAEGAELVSFLFCLSLWVNGAASSPMLRKEKRQAKREMKSMKRVKPAEWMEWMIVFFSLSLWIMGWWASQCSAKGRENKKKTINEWNEWS